MRTWDQENRPKDPRIPARIALYMPKRYHRGEVYPGGGLLVNGMEGPETNDQRMTRTNAHASVPVPKLYVPHPNFGDEVNRNIVRSEIEGGVYLDDLSDGEVLEVQTQNHEYTIVVGGPNKDLISGHPLYCPDPVSVRIEGSTWGGTMLKVRFVGRGMHLEFRHPTYHTIVTSPIVDIRSRDPLMGGI